MLSLLLNLTWTRQTALPSQILNAKSGEAMIFVPSSSFPMGDDEFKDARPVHSVQLDSYYIGKNLVTVAQFKKFCREAPYPTFSWGRKPPPWGWQDNHPMLFVTWHDATAYAHWAGGDLPTEAQWEKAAKGPTNRRYPWGNTFDSSRLCCSVWELRVGPQDVGSYPSGASSYGCLDMAGNAAQWCKDWYSDLGYMNLGTENPLGPGTGTKKVARGGNWYFDSPEMFRTTFKGDLDPSKGYFGIGFRICTPVTKKN